MFVLHVEHENLMFVWNMQYKYYSYYHIWSFHIKLTISPHIYHSQRSWQVWCILLGVYDASRQKEVRPLKLRSNI